MSEELVVGGEGAVATLVLNRPDRRNALSLALITQISDALAGIGRNPSLRTVILSARGPAFCAGHDLAEMRGRDEAFFQTLFGACTAMMLAIRALPQTVIAAVQGSASAGGCHLVAACDLAVAAEEATFAVPGPAIGLPGTTAMVDVARVVGPRRAMELLLTGRPIDAETAERWGLVNRVVPADRLRDEVAGLARGIARGSGPVLAECKRGVHDGLDRDLAGAYAHARDVMAAAAAGSIAQEGIAAFLEKRPPVWPDGA
jgi:enoyl-CoA hydratase/carnithine racemase